MGVTPPDMNRPLPVPPRENPRCSKIREVVPLCEDMALLPAVPLASVVFPMRSTAAILQYPFPETGLASGFRLLEELWLYHFPVRSLIRSLHPATLRNHPTSQRLATEWAKEFEKRNLPLRSLCQHSLRWQSQRVATLATTLLLCSTHSSHY